MPSAYHIEFQNVWKKLGGLEILRGIDLQIRRGETFVIIGLSGTGKSVSLKHIIGLMQPDYGRVLISGVDRSKLTTRERLESYKQFGYLFQSGALINWMTIYDNVALPLREHTNLPEEEIHARVMEKLALVNLDKHGAKTPSEVSGGMKKRAGLARAIVREPEILLYDEPTSGLDPVMSREVDRLIIKLGRELKVTNVLVTHDMESAYLCADRIGMLYQGRMLQVGTPEEIRDSRDPVVQAFITGGIIPTDPNAQIDLPSREVQERRTRTLMRLRNTRVTKRGDGDDGTAGPGAAATAEVPVGRHDDVTRPMLPALPGGSSDEAGAKAPAPDSGATKAAGGDATAMSEHTVSTPGEFARAPGVDAAGADGAPADADVVLEADDDAEATHLLRLGAPTPAEHGSAAETVSASASADRAMPDVDVDAEANVNADGLRPAGDVPDARAAADGDEPA